MASRKRTVIGSIYKGMQKKDKEGNLVFNQDGTPTMNPDYMKLRTDSQLDNKSGKPVSIKDTLINALQNADSKKGLVIQLASKKSQLEGIDYSVQNEIMSQETGNKIRERINKIPDYVRFELVLLED